MNIEDIKRRETQADDLLIEIIGEDPEPKVDLLVYKLRTMFDSQDKVRIVRPVRKAAAGHQSIGHS